MAWAVGGAGESGVDLFDAAVATDEEGGGPAVEADAWGIFSLSWSGCRREDGVGDAVAGDEGAQAGGVFAAVRLLRRRGSRFQGRGEWNCL